MRNVSITEKEALEQGFSDSIYQNKHLGWFDLWELSGNNGKIFLDDENGMKVLLGYQYISQSLTWLHSFYSDRAPNGYELSAAFRKCGIRRQSSVYTISSNLWYSDLLERNLFKKCDEIIQFGTDTILTPGKGSGLSVRSFESSDLEKVLAECECSFPPLWRMGRGEFIKAFENANYKTVVCAKENVIGYLLSDISEDHNCHIIRLCASPKHLHEGAASALVGQMIPDCKGMGVTSFSVNTNANNTAAVTFYRSLNFKQAGKTFPVWYRYI